MRVPFWGLRLICYIYKTYELRKKKRDAVLTCEYLRKTWLCFLIKNFFAHCKTSKSQIKRDAISSTKVLAQDTNNSSILITILEMFTKRAHLKSGRFTANIQANIFAWFEKSI